MISIILGIMTLVLCVVGGSIVKLTEAIEQISDYYFKKQRNQLNEILKVKIDKESE